MSVLTAPTAPTHELPGARFTSLATPSLGTTETAVWTVEILPGTDAALHEVTREEIFVGLAGVEFSIAAAGPAPFRALVCLPVGGQAVMGGGEPFTPPWAL